MKKFTFALDRVLSWRRTQVRLEEAALARLHGEVKALQQRMAALDQSVVDARGRLLAVRSAAPVEIGALEHFRGAAAAQTRYLLQSLRALEQKVGQQTQVVVERRREAKLLEQLRERRLEMWQTGVVREIDQQAEESFMAGFIRNAVE